MSTIPPLDTSDDLRRLALNAGTYGIVQVPAKALLDLLGDGDLEDAPSALELRNLVRDADLAAIRSEDAAADLRGAAEDLKTALAALDPAGAPALADGGGRS